MENAFVLDNYSIFSTIAYFVSSVVNITHTDHTMEISVQNLANSYALVSSSSITARNILKEKQMLRSGILFKILHFI